jgi:large subunit ribosomal protein L24|uniref:Large ribosomal subunit protein uL24 n=1 Tax=Acidicaldus sp. TaxID=1872105 RepID=A0A8J4H9N3_9PROT
MAARIRKGDRVQVISGADKGKRGEVLRVMPRDGRALVQGVAIATRHLKPRGASQPGGIERREATIDLSNIMLIDPATDKPTRIGFKILDDGRKVRVAKSSGQVIEK